jgi:hypothetical protein
MTFLDRTPKAQVTKEKVDKWFYTNTKKFCASKDNTNGMKGKPMEGAKIRTIHIYYISSKLLISRIYKGCLPLSNNKNTPINKWRKELSRHFSKENI